MNVQNPSNNSALNERLVFLAAVRQLHARLSPMRRRQLHGLVALTIAGGLTELAAVGSVLPFLSILAAPSGEPSGVARIGQDLLGAIEPTARLWVAAAVLVLAAVAAAGLRLWLGWVTESFAIGHGHDLAVEIHRKTLLQPYIFHLGNNSSNLVSSLEKVQQLVFGIMLQLVRGMTSAFFLLVIGGLLLAIDPLSTLVATVSLAMVYVIVGRLTRARLADNSTVLGSAYQHRVQILQESLGSIRDVIIDHSHAIYLDAFRAVDARLARARVATAFVSAAPRFIIEAAGVAVLCVIALVLAGRDGGILAALPVIGALAFGAQRLLPHVQQLYRAWASLTGNRSVLDDVLQLLSLPVSDEQAPAQQLDRLPLRELITFEKVGFAYPGQANAIIADVNFTIAQGTRLAIVGRTGSGKTTLADLLMGLIEPSTGRILIDGTPLTEHTRRAWRRSIAHVAQDVFVADTTVARNIAFAAATGELDMDRVQAAARVAMLDDYVASLPLGYDSLVGERGARISGGQRQRLGIARAVYKGASVLVLDEATNALDPETEAAVMRSLMADTTRTIVLIAHRETSIAGCHQILRLDAGRIV